MAGGEFSEVKRKQCIDTTKDVKYYCSEYERLLSQRIKEQNIRKSILDLLENRDIFYEKKSFFNFLLLSQQEISNIVLEKNPEYEKSEVDRQHRLLKDVKYITHNSVWFN